MADQGSNKINHPLALSSSTEPWWDLHHHATRPTLSTSSRNNMGASVVNLWEALSKLNSSPSEPENGSISASNHSSLTIDEPFHRFVRTPSNYIIRYPATDDKSHLQLLLGGRGTHEVGNDLLSLKCFSSGMIEPSACAECSRKLDSCHQGEWADINGDQYPNSVTNEFFTNNCDEQSINNNAGYNGDSTNLIENNGHQRSLNMLSSSNLVSSSWSNATSDGQQMMQLTYVPHISYDSIQPRDISCDQIKQNLVYQPQLFNMAPTSIFECENSGFNQMRHGNDQCGESEPVGSIPATFFPIMTSFVSPNETGYRPVGGSGRPRDVNMFSHNSYNPSNIDPFSNSCSKVSSKSSSVSLMEAGKLQQGTLSNSLSHERGQGAFVNEAKKKRSEDAFQSSSSLKKPKRNNSAPNPSTASSYYTMTNTRTPKGKVEAEKLSALQLIVSPYGKTDTATVLQEAIGFIRRHQENVQMLSNPYLKYSVTKLQESWGSQNRNKERNKVLDLKSKGLCLIPISIIPKEIKEDNNAGLEYWPAYRGFLYR